ncbi:MAG: hypothetical protein R3C99_12500 [Pirellulaceae bacterium]
MNEKPLGFKSQPNRWIVIPAVLLAIPVAIATNGMHNALNVTEFWRPIISGAIVGATTTGFLFYNSRQQRKHRQH